MHPSIIQHQQNRSQFQIYGFQSVNAEHFVQPQLPIQLVSQNVVALGKSGETFMPRMFSLESMYAHTGSGPLYPNGNFGNSNIRTIDPYSCNFLAQLEGTYDTVLPDAKQVQVELADDAQYANVRRQDDAGELVVEQLIYEEEKRFTLCTLEGFVLAIMLKGKDMRRSVTWYLNDGRQLVWHRTSDVTFKLVTVTPELSRRNSLVSNFSGISQMSCSQASANEVVSDVSMRIRSELQTQEDLSRENGQTNGERRRLSPEQPNNLSSNESQSSEVKSPSASKIKLTDDELFDQLKGYCRKFPSLLEQVVQWGITRTPNRRVGPKEISEFAAGRIWVRADLIKPPRSNIDSWQEVLNEFKGAYQEVEQDVFMQPPAQPHEPGKRHRIRKNSRGFWVIEEHNADENIWNSCVQEAPSGHWVDLKHRRRRYNIQIVPMLSILNRMQKHWTDHKKMEQSINFLFNSCNQKKLNTRLKARNLKHNINNLQLKLDKQYALGFAVRVAEIADSIALEDQNVICTKNDE